MAGREKPIDWKKVEQLLISGSSGTEIASHFDIHHDNFYARVVKEYGMSFTSFASTLRQKGDSLIRHKQFCKAMGYCTDGDNTMLIWLGKNRLKQKEREDDNDLPPNDKALKELTAELKQLKEQINASKSETDNKL